MNFIVVTLSISLEICINTLGIEVSNFTLIHLLFLSIVTYTKHPLYVGHCARRYFGYEFVF